VNGYVDREGAYFGVYLWRDEEGRACFANRLPDRKGRRFSVFQPRRTRRLKRRPLAPWHAVKTSAAITRYANLSGARRWLPENPLFAQMMKVEDAITARWKGRR
jgi:hypothetical protein